VEFRKGAHEARSLSGRRSVPYVGWMSDERNPLIPAGYDIAWSVITVVVVVLTVVALISLARSAKRLTDWQRVVWVALILLMPVIGSISWLAIGGRPHAAAPSG
jgi:uncharacterized membrane protein YhaH (DUF805 family)